jgi:hypothetical protein
LSAASEPANKFVGALLAKFVLKKQAYAPLSQFFSPFLSAGSKAADKSVSCFGTSQQTRFVKLVGCFGTK